MLNVRTVISCACTVQCRDKQYKHTCAGHQEDYIYSLCTSSWQVLELGFVCILPNVYKSYMKVKVKGLILNTITRPNHNYMFIT